jgi:hypothetical protein
VLDPPGPTGQLPGSEPENRAERALIVATARALVAPRWLALYRDASQTPESWSATDSGRA